MSPMTDTPAKIDALLEIVREVYENLPFNRHLGLSVDHLNLDEAGASAIGRRQNLSRNDIISWIARIGTIDMRVDYLRPGRGERFQSSGTVMRTGNKVAVTRMELRNEKDIMIAVGTGAYIVG
jgi:acyl-coenzyme A thioesterase PaaI-like protein